MTSLPVVPGRTSPGGGHHPVDPSAEVSAALAAVTAVCGAASVAAEPVTGEREAVSVVRAAVTVERVAAEPVTAAREAAQIAMLSGVARC
jgi:hypothetical protein